MAETDQPTKKTTFPRKHKNVRMGKRQRPKGKPRPLDSEERLLRAIFGSKRRAR